MSLIDQIKEKESIRRFVILAISSAISFILGILILLISFEIIIYYLPSEKTLADGTIEKHQPFVQFFISLAISIVFFAGLTFIGFKILNKKILK